MAAKFVLPRTSVILNQAYWKAVCAGLSTISPRQNYSMYKIDKVLELV